MVNPVGRGLGALSRVWMLLVLALALALAGPVQAKTAPTLRVMSFNVRYAAPDDGVNIWENRRDLLVSTISSRRPAVIGTQELLLSQAHYLREHLAGYAWFGRGRNGNEIDADDNEHMGIFYDTRRLNLIEHGDFWYSETPDVPGSGNFGQPLPRMATWAQFEVRATGRRFYLFDTHFPHRAEAEPVRQRCAELLLERIGRLPADVPVVITGDFNSGPESATHRALVARFDDTWEVSRTRIGPGLTVHGFTGKPTKRIDWVLVRGLGVRKVEIAVDRQGPLFPSDHYPVIADLTW